MACGEWPGKQTMLCAGETRNRKSVADSGPSFLRIEEWGGRVERPACGGCEVRQQQVRGARKEKCPGPFSFYVDCGGPPLCLSIRAGTDSSPMRLDPSLRV